MNMRDWTHEIRKTGIAFADFLDSKGIHLSLSSHGEYFVQLSNGITFKLYTNCSGNKRIVLPSSACDALSEKLLFAWEEFNGRTYGGTHLFVDGSFRDNAAGYGVIVISEERIEEKMKGCVRENLEMRNVIGEIEGVVQGLNYCLKKRYKEVKIHYDYEGLKSWKTGEWKAKNESTRKYRAFLDELSPDISIEWVKVKSHVGDTFNEIADKLAKEAVDECS
ncbi:MAG TPA: reverse transcriptase-like protein [Mesotoga infera]|uniref:Reverse transcriptase-like protein n=1 Tax=Mesotoga infera TaxID=1236046 RepID=A0A7C1GNW8_9BACT|nr:reverse transcriptase-like protein [Mesotoga infera]